MSLTSWLRNVRSAGAGERCKRSRRQATGTRPGGPCLQVERLEDRWCPSYTLVTSRVALAGTDSVNWGTLAPTPPPSNINVANPFSILSAAGRSISVSAATANSFDVTQQVSAPPYHGNGSWNGNFAVGDWVLDSNGGNGKTNPITLNFGATAVAAGGAQIQPNLGTQLLTFAAKVEAFDAKGSSLASFTEAGTATNAADNSAIFIGISSSSANISRIALSISKVAGGTGGDKAWFAINEFDFRVGAAALAPATASPALAGLTSQPPGPLPASTAARLGQAHRNDSALASALLTQAPASLPTGTLLPPGAASAGAEAKPAGSPAPPPGVPHAGKPVGPGTAPGKEAAARDGEFAGFGSAPFHNAVWIGLGSDRI